MTPLVLVGQAPGKQKRYEPRYALYPVPKGSAGDRLRDMMGLKISHYVALRRMNLLDYYPGPRFPERAGRAAAGRLLPELPGTRVLMMGQAVAKCFGFVCCQPLVWYDGDYGGDSFAFAVVPHPSGRNRWYNDRTNREAARRFLRGLGEEVEQCIEEVRRG